MEKSTGQSQCNNSLEQLKNRRNLWIECLSGNDRNSILNQINRVVWNAAVFKVINESRKYLPRDSNGEPEANAMLHNFVNRCFIDSQFSAIRRLTDEAYKLDNPKKGINSLVALLVDMRNNVVLMTRENMFKVDGLEYDYEVLRQREEEYRREKRNQQISSYCMPPELNSQDVRDRHEELDILCGVSADKRQAFDSIQTKVFDFLINKVKEATRSVELYVVKYVAHAATPASRKHDNADTVTVTFGQLWNVHKEICRVVNFVDQYMLCRTHHAILLPIPQYNHLEYIDKPLVTAENIRVMRKAWQEFQTESDSWGSWDIADFKKEIGEYNSQITI